MRPISVTLPTAFYFESKGFSEGLYKAKFHGFCSEGSNENGLNAVAIVEMENGQVLTVPADHIRFLDVGEIPTGITRRIDDLGRIVIPREIRRELQMTEGDPLEFFINKQREIVLRACKVDDEGLVKP